jgi:large repetitive protein
MRVENVMNKPHNFIAFLIVSSFFWLIPLQSYGQENLAKGLQWLTTVQQADGSWDNWTGTVVRDTTAAADAFQILDSTSLSYIAALQWLATLTPVNTDYTARRLYAFSRSNYDFSTDVNYLLSGRNADGGWGLGAGHESSSFNTTLALQALKAANYPDQTLITNAINYLLSTQNPNGGWGFYAGDDSNVSMTALVSSTLQQFPQTTSIATTINKATAYLIAHQKADGGFATSTSSGQGASTVFETALSYLALIGATTDATVLGNAITYLTSAQLPDGSWNEDPYSTALALRALANVKPNLAITAADIAFSNSAPTVGQAITITASIHNTGTAQANNVLVQFYSGDPSHGGTLIGGTTIPSIPAFGSSPASILWTPTASSNVIFVSVDPLNAIDELNKTDNTASRNLTSATLPDLSISSADITFSPQIPLPADAVAITATIRNNGETGAGNFTVDIYDGNPSAGGVNIFSTTVPSLGSGSAVSLQTTSNFTAGSHNINVVVDKANSVIESSKTNNTAVKTLQVGNVNIDLMVTNYDITSIPVNPAEGDLVTINTTIHNQGDAAAKNVLVRFYLGDPDSGVTQTGSDINIPSVSARGMANISTIWNSTGHAGNNNIYVKIDPLNTIIETTKLNNKAFKTIQVAAQGLIWWYQLPI